MNIKDKIDKLREITMSEPENMEQYGHYGDDGNFYITEPSKAEIVNKINEIIGYINSN